jgi:hypothetical protein
MDHEVNQIRPEVEVARIEAEVKGDAYRIQSTAGGTEITALVKADQGSIEIISWDIDKITN